MADRVVPSVIFPSVPAFLVEFLVFLKSSLALEGCKDLSFNNKCKGSAVVDGHAVACVAVELVENVRTNGNTQCTTFLPVVVAAEGVSGRAPERVGRKIFSVRKALQGKEEGTGNDWGLAYHNDAAIPALSPIKPDCCLHVLASSGLVLRRQTMCRLKGGDFSYKFSLVRHALSIGVFQTLSKRKKSSSRIQSGSLEIWGVDQKKGALGLAPIAPRILGPTRRLRRPWSDRCCPLRPLRCTGAARSRPWT